MTTQYERSHHPLDKLSYNIALRFKVSESKFGGDIDDCWIDCGDEYKQATSD